MEAETDKEGKKEIRENVIGKLIIQVFQSRSSNNAKT